MAALNQPGAAARRTAAPGVRLVASMERRTGVGGRRCVPLARGCALNQGTLVGACRRVMMSGEAVRHSGSAWARR